jgi:two-component system NtrC family sensor kinase
MGLYQKLVLFMIVAAVAPVAVVGFSLLSSAEQELEARIGAQQATAAAAAAQRAARDVEDAVETLVRAASPIGWRALSPEERLGALRLVLGQSRHFALAGLFDSQGAPLHPVLAGPAEGPSFAPKGDAGPFLAALPLAQLSSAGAGAVAISPAYLRGSARAAASALAFRVGGEAPWYLAVELRLSDLMARAAALAEGGAGGLYVLDAQGRVLACPNPEELLRPADDADRAAAASAQERPRLARYSVGGERALASIARVPGPLGWAAIIRLPARDAFAEVIRMRRTVLASLGGAFVFLLAAGFAFARGLSQRIERVAAGAEALSRGDLSARVPAEGADELAELARTFNAMGAELQSARQKLLTWNEELRAKVDERTAALKAAQAQLLEAQKLAAIGQLGAGVAHEINNPLAGILGHAQLLLLNRDESDRDVPTLRKIEAQAKRAKEITGNLLRFSQQRVEADPRPLDLNKVVRDATSLIEAQVEAEGIRLSTELCEDLPPIRGDPGHLAQVVLNLVANARTAMRKSAVKRLEIATFREGQAVRLRVRDTGEGIPEGNLPHLFEPFFTTKDVWSNAGLGLSVSYRIVKDHGGRIEVETEQGKGSAFTIELPVGASKSA